MPLIIISGYPTSGKTHRAQQLLDFFKSKISTSVNSKEAAYVRIARLRLHHISDQTLGLRPDVYREARTEKDARAAEFSAVERALGKDDIVIADGMNYIKGFRYQLYCAAKAVATPSCVIHIGTPISTCREINTRLLAEAASESGVNNPGRGYPEDIFENLIYRYEEPNGMNRWDKPLFTVLYDDPTPPFEEIWEVLIGSEGKVKTVKPHQATVLKPATSSNHLYDLDLVTQEVLSLILSYQTDHPGEGGGQISVPGVSAVIELPTSPLAIPQLQRMRRQFINLNRQHMLQKDRVKELFVEYLNDSFVS